MRSITREKKDHCLFRNTRRKTKVGLSLSKIHDYVPDLGFILVQRLKKKKKKDFCPQELFVFHTQTLVCRRDLVSGLMLKHRNKNLCRTLSREMTDFLLKLQQQGNLKPSICPLTHTTTKKTARIRCLGVNDAFGRAFMENKTWLYEELRQRVVKYSSSFIIIRFYCLSLQLLLDNEIYFIQSFLSPNIVLFKLLKRENFLRFLVSTLQ